MGRPLNKKYFANTNYQDFGTGNVGGESVASVAIVTPVSATFTTATATFSAPQIAGGAAATGTVTLDGDGDIAGITILTAGSGYTSLPTILVSGAGNVDVTLTSGSDTVTIALTANGSARQNGIKCEAQIGAGSEVTTGDIIKQVSTTRYKVITSDGTAVCKLVQTADLGANEMSIIATDSANGTYYVKKLTAHRVVLVPIDGTQFDSGESAKWSFTTTIVDAQVTIANQ